MSLKQRAKKLKEDIPTIYLCLKDKKCPLIAKLFCVLVLIYALSPIDLIPDFIPILGYLDDLIVLPALIVICVKLIPNDLMEEKRIESKELKIKKKWYYALPFIIIWILVIVWLIRIIYG